METDEDDEEGNDPHRDGVAKARRTRGAQVHIQLREEGPGIDVHADHCIVPSPRKSVEAKEDCHPPARGATEGSEKGEVDHHGAFEEEREGPLIAFVGVVAGLPQINGTVDQSLNGSSEGRIRKRTGVTHPKCFTAGCQSIEAELAKEPGKEAGYCSGKDETEDSSKC